MEASEFGDWRDTFWAHPPEFPAGLSLTRQETIVAARVGRGGETVIDLGRLESTAGTVHLLVVARPNLLARDVARVKKALQQVADDQRRRLLATGGPPVDLWPAVATDVATPSVIEAGEREGVGILDRQGTVILHARPVFLHVVGSARVTRKPRVTVFKGKGARLVRIILQSPTEAITAQAAAARAQTSYVYAHGVLSRLEQEGYLERKSPRSGFRPRDPGALLRAWLDSRQRTAASVEGFYAPSTLPEALATAESARRRAGVAGIFTLASALEASALFASGLPHGIYLSGEAAPVIDALHLRRVTPHNFLILRAEAAAETEAGGIYFAPRRLTHGQGVALPQLAVDFTNVGGRGPDQAQKLLERYIATVPYAVSADD